MNSSGCVELYLGHKRYITYILGRSEMKEAEPMQADTAIEQIAESLKNVCHSKKGRYFVTCRNGCFIFLTREEFRSGDDELGNFSSVDLSIGLTFTQWHQLRNTIFDYLGGNE